jgi:hypothetical protein
MLLRLQSLQVRGKGELSSSQCIWVEVENPKEMRVLAGTSAEGKAQKSSWPCDMVAT